MWGAIELYEEGEESEREYVKGMRTTPIEPGFRFEYFDGLIDDPIEGKKRSAKGLLTQDQLIPGLGNAIAQDILFRARLHPRHPIADLSGDQRRALYRAIVDTVHEVIEKGGRYDEYDLYGRRGGYVRLMDSKAVGSPCPECKGKIEKMQYLGGSCYYCPRCQE
jgi:formamidopyrimidine-DNA glycosylase